MERLNILFLGGAKRVSLGQHFIEYGKKHNILIKIYSYELEKNLPIASIATVIIGLRWKDENIINDLSNIIYNNNINIVLPFVDPAISIACVLKEKLPHIFIPVSSLEICKTMFDKKESANWFTQHAIPQPSFYQYKEDIKYPVILKPRTGSASKGLLICTQESELPNNLDPYLIQEYMERHTEISVDCYVGKDSRILSIVPRIRLETAGGEAVKSMTVKNDEITELSSIILKSGDFYGPITIQFLKNESGSLFVMEINPRFGGGVVTSIGAGSGVVSLLINEALNRKVDPIKDWKPNTLMVRYLQEVIFYADNF